MRLAALLILASCLPAGAADVVKPVPAVVLPSGPAKALMPLAPIAALEAAPRGVEPLATALEAGRRIIDAVRPGAGVPVEAVCAQVFDGRAVTASAGAVSGLSGAALLADLHERSGAGFRENDYNSAHAYLFKTADRRVVGGRSGVADAYSGVFVAGESQSGGDYPEPGDDNHDGQVDAGMNVEHVWPQSFFAKRLPMRSDLHHLMATFIHPNGVRGDMPFGVVRGQGEYHNDAGAKAGQGVFEPPDFTKGRVARALLYFYVRYYDKNITNGAFSDRFWNANLGLILDWNRRFPPDDWERARNGLVERFQGNRNPFVDDHTLADQIGADALKKQTRMRPDHIQLMLDKRRARAR